MIMQTFSRRVWGTAFVCAFLCGLSFIALAQARQVPATSPPPAPQAQAQELDLRAPPKPDLRTGGYLKIGDIKGDTPPAAAPSPSAHTPEWTDVTTGDPGRATNSQHQGRITLDSASSHATPTPTTRVKINQVPPAYECPPGDIDCYCEGVLDCKNLWSSGVCKPNTEWEDGNNKAKGGCIEQ